MSVRQSVQWGDIWNFEWHLCIRAWSLNHFIGEPDRGAPNFSQSQRGISITCPCCDWLKFSAPRSKSPLKWFKDPALVFALFCPSVCRSWFKRCKRYFITLRAIGQVTSGRQPTLWLYEHFLEVLTVHFNEFCLFGAKSLPPI